MSPLRRNGQLRLREPGSLCALLLTICLLSPLRTEAAPRFSIIENCVKHSAFIFIGTVGLIPGTTMPPIPANDSTFVVSVDDTILVPSALGNHMQQLITVVSHDLIHLNQGEQYFFFVVGFLYGPSMAAEETCRLPVDADSLTIRQYITQIQSDMADENLSLRLKQAETVVLGRVTSTAPFTGGTPQPSIGSEHNPDWWEAEVQVISTEKGRARSTLRVLFPHSIDVAWSQAPKLVADQDAILILDRIPIQEFATDRLTVTHPLDVQSPRELVRIQSLLRRLRIR